MKLPGGCPGGPPSLTQGTDRMAASGYAGPSGNALGGTDDRLGDVPVLASGAAVAGPVAGERPAARGRRRSDAGGRTLLAIRLPDPGDPGGTGNVRPAASRGFPSPSCTAGVSMAPPTAGFLRHRPGPGQALASCCSPEPLARPGMSGFAEAVQLPDLAGGAETLGYTGLHHTNRKAGPYAKPHDDHRCRLRAGARNRPALGA